MPAPRLYPDAPHLAVAVYRDCLAEREVFARLCRAVRVLSGDPAGLVQVFPEGTEFEWLTDLGTDSEEIEVPGRRFWDLVEGKVPGLSAVKAGFRADPAGLVVVSYELREGSKTRQPINAHISAGALGDTRTLVAAWGSAGRRLDRSLDQEFPATRMPRCETALWGTLRRGDPSGSGRPESAALSRPVHRRSRSGS